MPMKNKTLGPSLILIDDRLQNEFFDVKTNIFYWGCSWNFSICLIVCTMKGARQPAIAIFSSGRWSTDLVSQHESPLMFLSFLAPIDRLIYITFFGYKSASFLIINSHIYQNKKTILLTFPTHLHCVNVISLI